MDGILIIDKPQRLTSHDVVSRLRRILRTKKIGHTGTLDPFATGVLVMLVGRATRLAQFLDKDEKEYDALVKFGYATDTGDRTGTRMPRAEELAEEPVTPDRLLDVIPRFMGPIMQVPPMYSAKKVAGRKLYELAREGKEIARKPFAVTIRKLELSTDRLPAETEPGTFYLRFLVACSAGTYIRTLAEDIGRELGPEAHLAELRRTRAGRFTIEQAATLDELEQDRQPLDRLTPMSEALVHLPAMRLSGERAEKTLSGLATRLPDATLADGETVRMLGEQGELIAVGRYHAAEEIVQPRIVLG